VNYFGLCLYSLFGFMLVVVYIQQALTGFLLMLYYVCKLFITFDVVNYIAVEVYWGWLVLGYHNVFASCLVSLLYLHLVRGMFIRLGLVNGWYVNWLVGIVLLVVTLVAGVLGYILPFGNLGYWAYSVIKSIVSYGLWVFS